MRIAAGLTVGVLVSALVTTAAELAPPEALLERHIEAFNRGDAKAVAALYAEDAKLIEPDGTVLRGRRDIESFWSMLGSRRRIRLTAAERETSGPLAYMIGNYSFTDPTERGTFTIFFKRGKDGSWKIVTSMWNESRSVGYTPLQ